MKMISPVFQHAVFGRTIELNILGEQKICSFDCSYCSLGPSAVRISRLKHDADFPDLESIVSAVGRELGANAQTRQMIETVLVSGNGEPTLYPHFFQFAKSLVHRRNEMASITTGLGVGTQVVVLTNGDQLDSRDIVDGLNLFDECVLKIDTGTEKAFKKLNRPLSRSSLEKIIAGAKGLKNLSVQTMITGSQIGGDFSMINGTPIDDWIEVIGLLGPKKVYLQQAIAPCTDPSLILASEEDLFKVAHWLERRLKIKALVQLDSAA